MTTTEPPTWGAKLAQLARRIWHTYCQQQEEIFLARYGYLTRFKDKENQWSSQPNIMHKAHAIKRATRKDRNV